MARNLRVVHVTTNKTTEYKCEKAEPYGTCITLFDAKITGAQAADAEPARVFLLDGAVYVYGKMGEQA